MEAQKIGPIPEFMLTERGQYGSFRFNTILGIKLNHENPGNHTLVVQLQNIKNNFPFTEEISPELLRLRYKMGKTYKKGKLVTSDVKDKKLAFVMDTSYGKEQEPIFKVLSKNNIQHIVGPHSKNGFTFGGNFCYVHETEEAQIVIPSSAVLLYYYLRSSSMIKAVFKGNYHLMYDETNSQLADKNDAHLILNPGYGYLDGPFIYRFATSNIAGKGFVDIFRYISNKVAKNETGSKDATDKKDENDKKNENKIDVPIKALFPIKESFVMHIRYEVLPELANNKKPIYYAHEILNDASTLDFEKLTISKIKKVQSEEENNDAKNFVFKGRRAKRTLNKTTNKTPSRKYSTSYQQQQEDETNLGLEGKIVKHETLEVRDDGDLRPHQEPSDNSADISFAQAQNSGDENTRQASLEASKAKAVERLPNFDLFKVGIEYLENSGLVSDFEFEDSYDDIPYVAMDNGKPYSLCEIYGRAKTYMICSFVFNELNVTLVEVESEGADFATWVLISKQEITWKQVYDLLALRYKNDAKIEDLKKNYTDSNELKFEIKKHVLVDENGDVIYEKMDSWLLTLLGKIV